MEPQTYQGATMAQALADVKRSLGRDAVILNTRRLRRGGLLGLIGGRCVWEVQAVTNLNVPRRVAEGRYVPVGAPAAHGEAFAPLADAPCGSPAGSGHGAIGTPGATRVAEEMGEIRRMVQSLITRQAPASEQLSEPLRSIHSHLLDQEVEADVAAQIVDELRESLENQQTAGESVVQGRLVDLIARRIRVAGDTHAATAPDRPTVIALIGPTGVGKTTTIAKMAANLTLREGRKVGLITIDTYRIAAVDQLRTYAEIIEVPLKAVLTPGELHGAIRAMGDRDVVLIDTAGRSQNDQMRLRELESFMSAAQADEVHLVVSAAASARVAKAARERFNPLGANRIVITKLDEAASFGMILNLASATEAAVSFVTTGQDVPDDIMPAEANLLAQSVVKGSWHEG